MCNELSPGLSNIHGFKGLYSKVSQVMYNLGICQREDCPAIILLCFLMAPGISELLWYTGSIHGCCTLIMYDQLYMNTYNMGINIFQTINQLKRYLAIYMLVI